MTSIFSRLFKKKSEASSFPALALDMHSHLLPGIDDGVEDLEQALQTIKALTSIGYETLVTTPHVMGGVYNNDATLILQKRDEVREYITRHGINIRLEASAEYFLDEVFMDMLKNDKSKLLPFGKNYILIETSFMYSSPYLDEAIFLLQASGYRPVLAHPERYIYLHEDWNRYCELHDKGLLFQLNLSSLTGYYSPMVKKIARRLIDEKMIDLAGTDCHGARHIPVLEKAVEDEYYKKLVTLPLLNNSLFS
ncbi:MAG TPA: CpsB/CapC family capsule biosynthesis tyrosine phosphatase [Cytophagaceae bacterium]|jgi:protein-tyrosine phosphatase|nr:CpsB/CapC family capsule biosynthesis tyrosine phosphatase [Cytophagaceae bacterium]